MMWATGCATFQEPGDDWFARDKAKHFVVAATISAVATQAADRQGYSEGEARFIAFGVTVSLGTGKELYDQHVKQTYFSGKDMVWNVLGTAAGNALMTLAD